MARTDQRAIPIALVAIALALVAARIAVSFTKSDVPRGAGIHWLTPEEGLSLASSTNKPILYDFTAEWCQPCHMLDAEVFQKPEIARDVNERFIAIRVIDRRREEGRNPPDVQELQQRFGVRGFPTIVFADGGGERARMEGFRGREEFERVMESVR